MEKQDLQNRITKKEEQIKKLEKKILKLENNKNEENFYKKYEHINWLTKTEIYNRFYNDYIKDCESEIRRATRNLEEAKLTIKKYQNMLQVELAKENELENNKIDVIWNFLLNYKEMVKDYIRDNLKRVEKYYEYNKQLCDWHNNNGYKVRSGELTKEEYNKVYKELEKLEYIAKSNIHPITLTVARKNYETKERYIDEEELEKILLKDITSRYFQLIDQITKYTGKIQDASDLSIGNKGDLNGIITGEDGKAKVETISAGGYNIQCYHYRTLVNPIK